MDQSPFFKIHKKTERGFYVTEETYLYGEDTHLIISQQRPSGQAFPGCLFLPIAVERQVRPKSGLSPNHRTEGLCNLRKQILLEFDTPDNYY